MSAFKRPIPPLVSPAPGLEARGPAHISRWRDAGFSDDFMKHCLCTGWTFTDVSDVLCADETSDSPIDWCYTGLDPLEVHAAIRDGIAAPGLQGRRDTRIGDPDG